MQKGQTQKKQMFAPSHAACCEERSLLQSLGTGRKQGRMDMAESSPAWDKHEKGKGKHGRAVGVGLMEQNPPTIHMRSTQIHFFPINASLLTYFPFTNWFGLQSVLQLLVRNYSSSGACNTQSPHFHLVSFFSDTSCFVKCCVVRSNMPLCGNVQCITF